MIRHPMLVLPLLASLAFAAPVPKDAGRDAIVKLFGDPFDPEKACSAKLTGETLTLTLKANTAAGTGKDRTNLPRFTREVAGDFTASVRVFAVLPKKATQVNGLWTETGGGIVFIPSGSGVEKAGRVYEWGLHDFEYRGERMLKVPNALGVGPVGSEVLPKREGLLLRVARRGTTLELAYGRDGKVWDRIETWRDFTDRPMQVGVYATHNLTAESVVTLSDFSLTQPKEAKK